MRAHEYLGGGPEADGTWTFKLGREFHGAFGGAFGGIVAATALISARPLAADRRPTALDCRFLRGIGAGEVKVTPELIYRGRSLAAVRVEIVDERDKLAAAATISFADPAALADIDADGREIPNWRSHADGKRWKNPPGVEIPILETLDPRSVGFDSELGSAWAIPVPWDLDGDDTSAEAACLAADLCVGPPVASALRDRWVPHPNPDLSLRFAGAVSTPDVVGAGRLERIQAGVAAVSITVSSGSGVVARGVSTSLLLAS